VCLEVHLEAKIKLNSDMHLQAVIERVGGCIWLPQSCNSEMHLAVKIERVGRCTGKLSLVEIGWVHGGGGSGGSIWGGRCSGSRESID